MTGHDRLSELTEEFRTVVVERSNIIDSIVSPAAFLILNLFVGLQVAIWGSLGIALMLTAWRLIRGRPVGYALGGLGATSFAILSARVSNRAEAYFLPNLVTDGLIIVVCLLTVIVRRPLVALTSHVARQWPLEWYWDPRVRPAYTEVTLAWAIFFALRLVIKWFLFQEVEATVLGILNLIMGWPATILLLVLSYLYGTWRLRTLAGPSVKEFREGTGPPWEGQQRGF